MTLFANTLPFLQAGTVGGAGSMIAQEGLAAADATLLATDLPDAAV